MVVGTGKNRAAELSCCGSLARISRRAGLKALLDLHEFIKVRLLLWSIRSPSSDESLLTRIIVRAHQFDWPLCARSWWELRVIDEGCASSVGT